MSFMEENDGWQVRCLMGDFKCDIPANYTQKIAEFLSSLDPKGLLSTPSSSAFSPYLSFSGVVSLLRCIYELLIQSEPASVERFMVRSSCLVFSS